MKPSKREALLDTAEHLFYEESFHATGIDRVVREAGVARMTLYNHFPSKEALVEAVLVRRYERYLDELRAAMDARGTASAVMALAGRHGDWLRTVSSHGCIVLKAIGEFERHQDGIAALGRRLKDDLLELIGGALEQDGHPGGAATAERIMLVLEGATALVPVLGPDHTIVHIRGLVAGILDADARAQETT